MSVPNRDKKQQCRELSGEGSGPGCTGRFLLIALHTMLQISFEWRGLEERGPDPQLVHPGFAPVKSNKRLKLFH